ncbi:unnamed protein product [Hydatigera taeniaeformis]|uniref:PHD finger protein 10 n=1 Tax=Hydatigena taeniaeformis TaxID=6205 RepID=A0A0R3WWK5_HYDTA|nr:unnamed protein product [Hydatigera taeniaeformis]
MSNLVKFTLHISFFLRVQEELTKIISVINLLSNSNEKATVDTISSHLSSEAPSADRLVQILNEAVSRGSIVKNSEDGSYQPTRSLRPHRRSFLISQPPSILYDANTPRRRTVSIQRAPKMPNDASASTRGMSHIIPICGFCSGDENNNPRRGGPEEMLACWGCGRSAHLSCLGLSPSMLPRVKRLRWYCVDCKRCTICHYSRSSSLGGERTPVAISGGATDKDSDLLLCDNCDRGYHLSCVAPGLTEPPDGEFCSRLVLFHKVKCSVSLMMKTSCDWKLTCWLLFYFYHISWDKFNGSYHFVYMCVGGHPTVLPFLSLMGAQKSTAILVFVYNYYFYGLMVVSRSQDF